LYRALKGEQFTNIERYGIEELQRSVYEVNFSPMRNDNGDITGVCVFAQNISDKLNVERQKLLAEKKFGEIFENSPDAVFVEDSSGTILDVNKAACALQGEKKEKLKGNNIRNLVPANLFRKVITDYKKIYLGTMHAVESYVWSTERGIVPVEISGKKIHYDDKPALLLLVRDISERKKMEAERRQIEIEKMKQKEEMLLTALKIQEEERNRIAAEIHDDIGAGLSKISVLCQVIKKSKSCESVSDNIEKILLSSREVQDSINEIIWAMNPMNDKLENLVAYINYYASEFLETNMIAFNILLPKKITSVTVIGKTRRNIFLVIKEALNNVVKYAEARSVTIEINFDHNIFKIGICDTGRGFDLNHVKRFKNGINNMKKRTEEINGIFLLSSFPGKGTSIKLEIPIPTEI
jgi:PAS domain S-box-containing protein